MAKFVVGMLGLLLPTIPGAVVGVVVVEPPGADVVTPGDRLAGGRLAGMIVEFPVTVAGGVVVVPGAPVDGPRVEMTAGLAVKEGTVVAAVVVPPPLLAFASAASVPVHICSNNACWVASAGWAGLAPIMGNPNSAVLPALATNVW